MLRVGALLRVGPGLRRTELRGRLSCPRPLCAHVPVRGLSGTDGGSGEAPAPTPGWYGSLADSAPVHLCEDVLVSVQQLSGLPWWMSIIAATLTVRTAVTLPLAAYQLIIVSKVSPVLVPQTAALSSDLL